MSKPCTKALQSQTYLKDSSEEEELLKEEELSEEEELREDRDIWW
jgi:hypothetical protein